MEINWKYLSAESTSIQWMQESNQLGFVMGYCYSDIEWDFPDAEDKFYILIQTALYHLTKRQTVENFKWIFISNRGRGRAGQGRARQGQLPSLKNWYKNYGR